MRLLRKFSAPSLTRWASLLLLLFLLPLLVHTHAHAHMYTQTSTSAASAALPPLVHSEAVTFPPAQTDRKVASPLTVAWFVSALDGDDNSTCGASASTPCRTLQYTLEQILATKQCSTFAFNTVFLFPATYSGAGNMEVDLSHFGVCPLRLAPAPNQAGTVVFDANKQGRFFFMQQISSSIMIDGISSSQPF